VVTQDKCPGCEKIKPLYVDYAKRWPTQMHMLNLTEFAKINKKSSVQYLKQCFGLTIKNVPSAFFLLPSTANLRHPLSSDPEIDSMMFGPPTQSFWRHAPISHDRFLSQLLTFFNS
jgi:hypothetical protein